MIIIQEFLFLRAVTQAEKYNVPPVMLVRLGNE
jgi:hypothetical protein